MALTLGGIIGACGLFCGFLSWVLMCPGHPRDPEEDIKFHSSGSDIWFLTS